jgi:predicted RNA-binding Zn-ribbon protein involved in translation (DUF1610 family)
MPNWAFGDVTVTGDADNIQEFVKHFLYEDKDAEPPYFARSFSTENYSVIQDQLAAEMEDASDPDHMSFCMVIEFAWSAYSCLVDGYPQESKGECLTLEQACQEHQVTVEIRASEDGLAFSEHYICTPAGFELDESKDYERFVCSKCGEEQSISPFSELDSEECWECGAYGPGTWKAVNHD